MTFPGYSLRWNPLFLPGLFDFLSLLTFHGVQDFRF